MSSLKKLYAWLTKHDAITNAQSERVFIILVSFMFVFYSYIVFQRDRMVSHWVIPIVDLLFLLTCVSSVLFTLLFKIMPPKDQEPLSEVSSDATIITTPIVVAK